MEAEVVTDPEIVSVFYRQFQMAMRSKGLTPEFGIERPRALFEHLHAADRLFAVWVKYDGKVIASAFYPHDGQTMYFWEGGYDPQYLHASPNEFLHWTAMKAAIARGISTFNIGGAPNPSRFTQKFGGTLIPHIVYERSLARSFNPVLSSYRQSCQLARRLLQIVPRIFAGLSWIISDTWVLLATY